MQAITYSRFGLAAEVLTLEELPDTDPGPGEVAVDLALSGVNPSDVKSRAGSRPGVTRPAFDRIVPHSDGAGHISAVGPGVDPARLGTPVWIWNGQWQRPFGTAATRIVLPAEQAVPLPADVPMETGAVLGIPGLTACHAVFGGGEVQGRSLLIQGGAGMVGLVAVQLARWAGAHVIATARPEMADRLEALGANHVIPYDAPDLAAQILDANHGALLDRIVEVEFGLNAATDTEVIAPNGTIAAYGSAKDLSPTMPFGPMLFKAVTIDILLIYLLQKAPRDAAIRRLHAALSDGALTVPVAATHALADTAAAHEAVERGGRWGAILVDCSP